MKKELVNELQVFATGAFLKPIKVVDGEGKEKWIWYVSEFIDDSFKDGEVYNPIESAETLKSLITETVFKIL